MSIGPVYICCRESERNGLIGREREREGGTFCLSSLKWNERSGYRSVKQDFDNKTHQTSLIAFILFQIFRLRHRCCDNKVLGNQAIGRNGKYGGNGKKKLI